jgi:Protein of unknown function (DUF2958)
MLTHEDRRQLTANGIAAKTVVWAEDLVPVCRYTSHGIVWLLVSLDDDGALSCVVDWGYGYFILDRLAVEDFLAGRAPMTTVADARNRKDHKLRTKQVAALSRREGMAEQVEL